MPQWCVPRVTSCTHFIQIWYEKCRQIILGNYDFQAVTHKQSPDYMISQTEISILIIKANKMHHFST